MKLLNARVNTVAIFILCAALSCVTIVSSAYAEISQKDFSTALEEYIKTAEGKKLLGSTVENYFKERQASLRKDREVEQKKQMEEQFKKPADVPVGTSPTKGPKDAAVTIIEFSDFQCPYCTRANNTVMQVLKEYKGKVRVAFKNLPLPFHKEAKPAAAAALAAGEQGKFWEFHDELFKNQKGLNSDFYTKTAKGLGLDMDKFKKDMASEKVTKQIEDDMALARKHGISGTPGFFVNGVAVKGAQPFPVFKDIIDRWLEKKG